MLKMVQFRENGILDLEGRFNHSIIAIVSIYINFVDASE